MQTAFFFLVAAATAVAQLKTSVQKSSSIIVTSTARPGSAPTNSVAVYTPDNTIDSWICATKNTSDYLKPPMPTAHMLDVFYDHSDKIYAECEADLPKPFTSFPACPSVAKASWCAVSKFQEIS
jgi:hypothetical protein